jgi:hypothetical protein
MPILASMEKMFNHKYKIHLRILAVKKEFGTLGIHYRYEFHKQTQGFGRWTTQESHDASYNNMPQTVSLIERSPFLSSISIYDRANSILYEKHRDLYSNWFNNDISATQTIKNFRNKPLTEQDKYHLDKSWNDILVKKQNRHAPADEIEIVKKIIHDLTFEAKPQVFQFRP